MMYNDGPDFEFYVLNYEINERKVEMFNIFRNIHVYERTLKAVRKYLRAPSKFKYESWGNDVAYGFDGFCKELDSIIKWQEWSRCEYEIEVGGLFCGDNKLEKWDCYKQAHKNIEIIARDVIYKYRAYEKSRKNDD